MESMAQSLTDAKFSQIEPPVHVLFAAAPIAAIPTIPIISRFPFPLQNGYVRYGIVRVLIPVNEDFCINIYDGVWCILYHFSGLRSGICVQCTA